MINNNIDLWSAMMGGPVTEFTEEQARDKVEKTVFKYTDCGCCFSSDSEGVTVAGYAEGSDAELPAHSLNWGFTYGAWCLLLDDADSEGVEEWNLCNGDTLLAEDDIFEKGLDIQD